jgi:hypothetical protein
MVDLKHVKKKKNKSLGFVGKACACTTTSKSFTQTTQHISWQSSTKRALDTNIAVCVCKVTNGDAL